MHVCVSARVHVHLFLKQFYQKRKKEWKEMERKEDERSKTGGGGDGYRNGQ